MKSLIALLAISLSSLCAQAAVDIDYSSIVGEYNLTKKISGTCGRLLSIEVQDFLNQKTTHSLGFYSTPDDSGAVVGQIYYELTVLNTGVDLTYPTNPMTGLPMGSVYNFEVYKNNKIQAVGITRNVLGVTQVKTTLDAEFKGNSVKIKSTYYNTLSGKVVTSNGECEYTKIK